MFFFFFCESLLCFGFFVVDEAEGPETRQNALVPDGCSCGTGNQAQLTIVTLVNPVAQETRIAKPPSRQHKVDSQVHLGFPWDTRVFTGVQETEVRGDQAVVGCSRKTESMGSCDVHVLPESFTSFKQRGTMRHTRFVLLDHVGRQEEQRCLTPGSL